MCDSGETEKLVQNEQHKDDNKGFTCRRAFVIPVLILYFYALGVLVYAIPEYVQSRVKESLENEKHKNGHEGTGKNISPCVQNQSSPEYHLHTKIQQESAKWMVYVALASYLPALISNLVFGSYSDVLGRKFVFGISTLGCTLRCVIITIVIQYKASLMFIVLGTFIDGASGSAMVFFAVLFSYVSDITNPDKTRTFAIVLFELLLGVTVSVSSLLTGYFINYKGYFYPMLTATIMLAVAFILSVTIIPETLHHGNRGENKSCVSNVVRCIKLYVSPDSRPNRCKYILLIISFTFMAIPNLNRMSLEALYQLGRPFCWDPSKIGWFGTVKITCMSLLGLGSVFIFNKCLKDDTIALIGNISGLVSFVVEGLATTSAVLYTGMYIGLNIQKRIFRYFGNCCVFSTNLKCCL